MTELSFSERNFGGKKSPLPPKLLFQNTMENQFFDFFKYYLKHFKILDSNYITLYKKTAFGFDFQSIDPLG